MSDTEDTQAAKKQEAKRLLLSGLTPGDVARQLNISVNTLYTWRRRGRWQSYSGNERAYAATLAAYLRLIEIKPENITPREIKMLDRYASLLATLAPTGDRMAED